MEEKVCRWWHSNDQGLLICELCPRQCKLKPGQAGFCQVRQATQEGLVLRSYGRASGFCIDPIEKKPLNHFLPGTQTLSFGAIGCNLGCKFCQNWHISKSATPGDLREQATPEQIAQTAIETGCPSVSFTYNEPIISAEYVIDVARVCHERSVKTVAVTAGYISAAAREEFFSVIDAANVDLKGFTEKFYGQYCNAKLQPVLETLKYIASNTEVALEVTTLVIPGANDSPEEMNAMTRWLVQNIGPGVPLHLSAYHPAHQLRDIPPTSLETLERCAEIAGKNGLRHVYLGNI